MIDHAIGLDATYNARYIVERYKSTREMFILDTVYNVYILSGRVPQPAICKT